ncbi:uncharacterized protein PHACADRAFT_173110 [Phanerochaete carnosa HHB-10118-sp]|uniref:Uncharacterized protein n=1 Tax=Phanerochaete carnosa (strain HHB-10118-sp) TaxID=650164 RepID=K5UY53_PHACS|nr:uncharacterized protein PHACADRAFT_173110 [Phanerochaete carnosa HHB-10118-sp]EKM55046.1 hypothetical protein PHACADRAFT_173110 [Phanerochaete carnosa HHB-10118-sp]
MLNLSTHALESVSIFAQIVPPPPPGTNYIAAISPTLTYMVVVVMFLGMFIPLLVTLFLLSTRELRHRPIFILNVFNLLFGVAMCSTVIWLEFNAILRSLDINKAIFPAFFLVALAPILISSTLFVRVIAVYSWSRISTGNKLLAYGFPIALSTARVINLASGFPGALRAPRLIDSATPWHSDTTKAECFIQLVENSLVVLIGLFLSESVDVEITLILFFVNPCMAIIGVLFATVWAANSHWQADTESPPPSFSLNLGSRLRETSQTSDRRHSQMHCDNSSRPSLQQDIDTSVSLLASA